MADLFGSGFIKDDGYNIETKGSIFDFMLSEKQASSFFHTGFFGKGDYVFGGGEVLAFAGFDFDENNCAVRVGHNKVDFSLTAMEIMVEVFEAFFLQIRKAMVFTPPAASSAVEWCGLSFEKFCKHLFGLTNSMFAVAM